MYFKDNNKLKRETNIDHEFESRKIKFPKFKMSLVGIEIIILVIIFILYLICFPIKHRSKEETTYHIDLKGDLLMTIYKGNDFNDPGYHGYDNMGNDLDNQVVVSSNVNENAIGEYEITYTLNNCIVTRYVSIIDKPIGATSIYLKGDNIIYLKLHGEYKEPGYIVIDSIDSTLTDKVIVTNNIDTETAGIYKIIYSVTNSSGVTTQTSRIVTVVDSDLSLLLDPEGYTNQKVAINIYVIDNYFDYLILPDGRKITDKKYIYSVSKNGTYKFISHNKYGAVKEKEITVNNIDYEKPSGSCQGSYGNHISSIYVNANDNIGISRYVINGNSYSSPKITLEKEMSQVTVKVYDKAGNTQDISCHLKGNSNPPSSNPPSSNPSQVEKEWCPPLNAKCIFYGHYNEETCSFNGKKKKYVNDAIPCPIENNQVYAPISGEIIYEQNYNPCPNGNYLAGYGNVVTITSYDGKKQVKLGHLRKMYLNGQELPLSVTTSCWQGARGGQARNQACSQKYSCGTSLIQVARGNVKCGDLIGIMGDTGWTHEVNLFMDVKDENGDCVTNPFESIFKYKNVADKSISECEIYRQKYAAAFK